MLAIKNISKLFLPFLSFMILVSSMSYTIDFHYCQGNLKSFSLFGKAKNCHEMASKMASCHHHKQLKSESTSCSEKEGDCCDNKTVNFISNVNENLLNLDFLKLNSLSLFVLTTNNLFSDFSICIKDLIPHAQYKPPLIRQVFFILFERFLL